MLGGHASSCRKVAAASEGRNGFVLQFSSDCCQIRQQLLERTYFLNKNPVEKHYKTTHNSELKSRRSYFLPTRKRFKMTTQRQVEANRRNAALSTGPRTEEGQAASSMNALRHGLTAKTPVVPTEDQDEFDQFREALIEDLAPVGALEERIAEEIIDLSWRLRRATVLEQGILAGGVAAGDERFFSKQKATFEITQRQVTRVTTCSVARTGRHGHPDHQPTRP